MSILQDGDAIRVIRSVRYLLVRPNWVTQEFEETLHLHLQLPDGSVVCTQGDILEDLTTVVDTPDRRVHQISFRKGGAWDAVTQGHRVVACRADTRNVWKRRGQSTPILFPVIGRNSVFDFGISGRRAAGQPADPDCTTG